MRLRGWEQAAEKETLWICLPCPLTRQTVWFSPGLLFPLLSKRENNEERLQVVMGMAQAQLPQPPARPAQRGRREKRPGPGRRRGVGDPPGSPPSLLPGPLSVGLGRLAA